MANSKGDPHGYSTIDSGSKLTYDEVEFGLACEEYRRKNGIRCLSCSQILVVAKGLGYKKHELHTVNGIDDCNTARPAERPK